MACSEAAQMFGSDPTSVYQFKATYPSIGELWPSGERRSTHRYKSLYEEAFKLALVVLFRGAALTLFA